MYSLRAATAVLTLIVLIPATTSRAAERLCDPAFEDCRAALLDLINRETVGIDVGFWMMEDGRYSSALINRWKAGVPVRVIMDSRANPSYPANVPVLKALADAGIPMREKTSTGIVHWKMMLFAGQNKVEFSGANFTPHAFKYQGTEPYVDYIDEAIYFSDNAAIVNSFKTMFDNVWTTTSGYRTYANAPPSLLRHYPTYSIDSRLNFPPYQNFATRSVGRYNAETVGIDSIMFRITDRRHTDALIAAMAPPRSIPVRLLTDEAEYRDPSRLWNAWNIDRLYAAGAKVRMEAHLGSLHQKSTILRGQRMVIFGSSNWTTPSASYQLEHNIFTTEAWFYDWFSDQFDRKWFNRTATESKPFVPLPPDAPVYASPANAATEQPLTVTLSWNAGLWAHVYDIYFGSSPTPPLLAANVELGPSEHSTDYVKYTVTGLQEGVTYYWKIVSKTMAGVSKSGPVWNLRTRGGSLPTAGPDDVVLYAANAPVRKGKWTVMADSTAAGGTRMATLDAGVKGSLSSPVDYFELKFNAAANVAYRLWIRGKAERNHWSNDSVWVQFNDSVTSSSSPTYRIGSTSATMVTLEDCVSCGLSAWGWNDNGYDSNPGALGPLIYFANSGEHTIRVLMREDGLSIDQIVLSRSAFLDTAPGATKNDGTILQEQGGTSDSPAPSPDELPSGWQSQDIGAVGTAGSASFSNGVFTVSGAGADVWGTSDAFHYAYRTLSGDGSIVARVGSISGTQAWTKMGVMIRGSTSASSAYAFMLVSVAKGLAFQRRTADGAFATHTSGGAGTAPYWIKLDRSGSTITASVSADGSSWRLVGSDTFSLPGTVLIGLAAHSHDTSTLATGRFDNVSVTSSTSTATLPAGWTSEDIGAVGLAGSAEESGGTFSISGAGADVWGTADAFHFAYRALAGDGEITARVASIAGTEAWTKVGVMIRASANAASAYAFMLVSAAKGLAFQRRTADGVSAVHTSGGAGTAPRWVKLTRTGNVISAAVSPDGSGWTEVGSDTFTLPSDVLVGLATTSHDTSRLATGTFDNVSVSSSTSTAALPAGWTSEDIGAVGLAGSAGETGGTFTVKGAGDDIWGTADAFHFAYRTLSGDGRIRARVASLAGSEAWTKVGVMIRGSASAASSYAFMLVSAAKGLAFQRRTSDGASAVHTYAGGGTAPRWVRLTRTGNVISAAVSSDGSGWTNVGSDSFAMPSDVLVGLATTSHDSSRLATGTLDDVVVSGS